MRVTSKSLSNNYLINLNKNLLAMQKTQNQLSSFEEISKPSDDPFQVSRIMSLDSSINKNEQYLSNIEHSIGWLDATDDAIQGTISAVQRVQELTLQAANGTYSDTEMDSVKEEIYQVTEEIAQFGNTNYEGRYIFAGYDTKDAPFDVNVSNELIQIGAGNNTDNISTEISSGVTVSINITSEEFLDPSGSGTTIGGTLQKIYNDLDSGIQSNLDTYVSELDEQLDGYLALASEVGAKTNRMEAAKEKNETDTLNLTELLTNIEDIDIAEKTIEYKSLSAAHEATLSAGSYILQPTLLDYVD